MCYLEHRARSVTNKSCALGVLKLSSDEIRCPSESIGLKFIPSQSELFRFISISVSEPMRIIPNQSEKLFVSRFMKNGQKSIRLNPINSETSIRLNPINSESSIRMNSNQSETKFSIQINPNQSEFVFIRIDSD